MARRAGQAGRIGVIIECLRRTDRTGLRLDNVALARNMMRGALQTAIQSGWSEEGVTKAAKQAGVVMELVEDPAHVPEVPESKDLAPQKSTDARRAPDVVAIAMALTALKALKVAEAKGEALKVEKYAKRVLDLWKNADIRVRDDIMERLYFSDANQKLLMWAPVAQGMRWAIRALGEQSETRKFLGQVLRGVVQPCVKKIKRAVELDSKKDERLGMIMYREMQSAEV